MDYEPAYNAVDCVVGRRTKFAHASNITLALPLLLLLLRCCCCCVPKLSMCLSTTGVPYSYVGFFCIGHGNQNDRKKLSRFFGEHQWIMNLPIVM